MENNLLSDQEEIDRDLWLWETEREWHKSLPKHTDVQWLAIFPEAKARWGKIIRDTLTAKRIILEYDLDTVRREAMYQLKVNKYPWRDDLIKENTRRAIQDIRRSIIAIDHRLQFLRSIGAKAGKQQSQRITEESIVRAREYPLDQILEVNRQGFAKCIWHQDTKPSLFCKKNFAHCFVCQKTGDTIAVLMQLEGLKFREAVLRLQN